MRARRGRTTILLAASLLCILTAAPNPARGAATPKPMPLRGAALRIALGLKDKQATDWAGKIELSAGKVVALTAKPPRPKKTQANSWQFGTIVRRGRTPRQRRIIRPVLLATLDAPSTARVTITTAQGNFSFALDELKLGQPLSFLNAQARVARVPTSTRLTDQPTEDDWPAAARAADGSVWVAYAAYTRGPAVNARGLHEKRNFDVL